MSATPKHHGQSAIIVNEWRKHWRIGLAAFVGLGLGNGILSAIFSIFILPLEGAFGWSRGEIALVNNALILPAIAAPFAGRWVDRAGARLPLIISTVLSGLGFALLGIMTGSLTLYYGIYGFLALGGMLTTGMAYSGVVCAAFVKSRGVSLAISRSGMSITSALLPMALYAAIAQFGWRGGYFLMAALILGIALPLVLMWIPDDRRNGAAQNVRKTQSVSFLKLLTDRYALTIAAAAALAYLPLMAVLSQAQPLLIEKGLEPAFAASMVGLTGVASLVGAIFTGFLLDRFWASGVAAIMLAAGAVGALILAFGAAHPAVAIGGVVLIGLTLGAEVDVVAYVIARYSGMARYSSVYGLTVTVLTFAVALGTSGIGILHDYFGDYTVALTIGAACFVASGLAYLSLGPYPAEDPA